MRSAVLALLCALCLACGVRPRHIVAGTRWTVPLIAPLENVELIVPVTINGKGPYPFLFAPGGARSMIDRDLAHELKLERLAARKVAGAEGKWRDYLYFRVDRLKAGDLEMEDLSLGSPARG